MLGHAFRRAVVSRWLDPVRRTLDDAAESVPFFFRDDDGGWDDDRLFGLLDVFEALSIPIDLALIPAAVSDSLANRLSARLRSSAGRIRLHQHGYSHANHEIGGKKCEFGPNRSAADQANDLRMGHCRLIEAFSDYCDPIFTPPWNRCIQTTADLLAAGPYRALSRNLGARQLRLGDLSEISVCIDWCRQDVHPESPTEMGREIAVHASHGAPVGIMLHHGSVPSRHHAAVTDLLSLLSGHPNAEIVPMQSLIGHSASTDAELPIV